MLDIWRTLDSSGQSAGLGGRGEKEKKGKGKDEATSEYAPEILTELICTILRSVSIEHPPEVLEHCVAAVSACIEEFDNTVPVPVLDNILLCVGAGPVVYITNPAAV